MKYTSSLNHLKQGFKLEVRTTRRQQRGVCLEKKKVEIKCQKRIKKVKRTVQYCHPSFFRMLRNCEIYSDYFILLTALIF